MIFNIKAPLTNTAYIAALLFYSSFVGCFAEQQGSALSKADFLPLYEQYLTKNLPSLVRASENQTTTDAVVLKLTVEAMKSIISASYLDRIDADLGNKISKDSIDFIARYRIIGESDDTKARIAISTMKSAIMPFVAKPVDKAKFERAEKAVKRSSAIVGKMLREWVGTSVIAITRNHIPDHVIKKANDLFLREENQSASTIVLAVKDVPDHVNEKAADLSPLVGEPDLNKYLRQYIMDCIDWSQEESGKSDRLYMNNFFMQLIAQTKVPEVIRDVSDEEIINDLMRRTLVFSDDKKTKKMEFIVIKVEVLRKFVDTASFVISGK